MRHIIVLLLLVLSASALKAQPVPVKMRHLNGYYFAGRGVALKNGVNYFAVTDRKTFEKMFGALNRPDTPNFSKEMLLVMVMPESNKESTLEFERVSMKAGDFIEVYCNQDLNHHRVNYSMNAIAVAAIPKSAGISRVIFYNQKMKKLETVEVGD